MKPEQSFDGILIRPTRAADSERLLDIYAAARAFMRRSGNLHQWGDGYPSLETLKSDMERGGSYVVEMDERVVATFFFVIAPEPTYAVIEQGAWLDDKPYGVIHRVASDGSLKGVMHTVLDFCFTLTDNIRIDTHRDNSTMRQSLTRYGFRQCGIIHLPNGDERVAYQKSVIARN